MAASKKCLALIISLNIIECQAFFIDESLFETYPPKQREAIVREVKQFLSVS
jgi:hypothetical protein